MSQDLLIGVDAGTSVLKVVAFDLDGHEVATASTPNRTTTVPGAGVEQDMAWTWEACAATLRALGDKLAGLAGRTAALSITGQGDGTWLVDAAGEPVAPAWLWLDGRSGEIVQAIRATPVGASIAAITGTGLNPSNQSAHLLWMQRYRPELLERAAHALHCKDWLYYKCCGEIATDPAEGVFTFGDYRTLQYDRRVLELLGLERHARLLPPIVDGTRHHGRLTEAAAAATGLSAGTPVVLSPLDVPCTILGSGGYAPGRSVGCSILGSTGMHARLFDRVEEIRQLDQVGYVMPFPMPGVRGAMMSHMAATLNVDWVLRLLREAQALGGGEPMSSAALLAALEPRIAAARPGAALFHPYISENGERGPFVDPTARAQLLGLHSGVGLLEIVRAVYEGIAFAARDCYESLGPMPQEVRMTGGAAKSAVLRSILASVLGRPIRVARREEAGAAGAAIVAAASIGAVRSVIDALPAWVDAYLDADTTAPDAALVPLYERLFPVYRAGHRTARPVWQSLAALGKVS